ncbi:hypothetical protein [Pontixanthobacter aquaemixtae]|uniref:Uncharacterized protein n=1 Tax=Pontixanthobacter aquaemixtae TaxID=1958940 RepID=A0A844ZSH2_9SPHN|nr:hypothetical protein [Pontixanthobacter aquaemixtae]MXO90262.1 hypothetical protein [Pontixanthobacter aquaemixtae]
MAYGYKIHLFGKHHERMTWLSELCIAQDKALTGCDIPASRDEFENIEGPVFREAEYWRASRWPDDPTRQLKRVWTWPKYGLALENICPKIVHTDGFFSGLSCESHYGGLQFMHAMASRPNESDDQTRRYIRGWSQFVFRVATGKVDLDANYCDAVRAHAGPAASRLAPKNLKYCAEREEKGKRYPAWTVRTLFTFHCDKMFTSKTCDVLPGDEVAKKAAIGAMFHLIQDSYSQSHAARGAAEPSNGPYDAVVECRPVKKFYYFAENKKEHGAADKAPEFAQSCRERGDILDPITAGARMLGYVDGGQANEDAFVSMMMEQVIGHAPHT